MDFSSLMAFDLKLYFPLSSLINLTFDLTRTRRSSCLTKSLLVSAAVLF